MTENIELPWDKKIEKAKEALKTSFWGDFIFGGLLVSGLFIFIESLNLPSSVNCGIGIFLFTLALFLVFSRLFYFKIEIYRIEKLIKTAEDYIAEEKYKRSLELCYRILENKKYLRIKEIWNNKAISLFRIADKSKPLFLGTYKKTLKIKYEKNFYEEALRSFNTALEIDPFYKASLFGKSVTLYRLKRFDEAIKSSEEILNIDPNYLNAWVYKGLALADLDRYQEALESYDKALVLIQNFFDTYDKLDKSKKKKKHTEYLEYKSLGLELENLFNRIKGKI